MARFDADAPDADEVGERNVVLRALKRMRAGIVLVPLVVGLLVAASIGASKLWADLPQEAATDPDVTCWNNTQAPISQCPQPQGKFGLRWVFPSFKPDDSDCSQVRRRDQDKGRPFEFACNQRYDQRPVVITYSVRTSLDEGLAFLRRVYGAKPVSEADGERLVFRSRKPGDDGLYRVTVAYTDHPFSVTVAAPDPDLRDTALDELVRYRPAEQLVVRAGA